MVGELQGRELELLRQRGSVGRLRTAFELHDFARARLTAHFRFKNPTWTEDRIREAVRERLLRIR